MSNRWQKEQRGVHPLWVLSSKRRGKGLQAIHLREISIRTNKDKQRLRNIHLYVFCAYARCKLVKKIEAETEPCWGSERRRLLALSEETRLNSAAVGPRIEESC